MMQRGELYEQKNNFAHEDDRTILREWGKKQGGAKKICRNYVTYRVRVFDMLSLPKLDVSIPPIKRRTENDVKNPSDKHVSLVYIFK